MMALAGLGVHLWLCNRGSHVQSFKMTSFRARQPLFSPADMMNVKYISEKLEEIQEIKNNLQILATDIKLHKSPSKTVLCNCNCNFSHFAFLQFIF